MQGLFKDLDRNLRTFQVKRNSRTFQGLPLIFKDFSRLCKPCSINTNSIKQVNWDIFAPSMSQHKIHIRDLKIQRRGQQQEHQKNNRFNRQNTCITLFSTFLSHFCTTTTWKCLISHFMEDVTSNDKILFLFLSLAMVPWNSASGGFVYNWQSKWVGIIAIKTERTQIHFLSDVLVTITSLDLKVPIMGLREPLLNSQPLLS